MAFTRYTPADPKQRYRERMGRTAVLMDEVRRQEKPSVSMEGGTTGAVPKENRIECEEYRAIVRTLPCMHCGIFGYTQFCHGDQGKGMGLKTDDRTGWPGCGPHDHRPGCHHLIGTSGTFAKETRRELEADYARRTRAEVLRLGLWPKNLPLWDELNARAA
jgi:hypothetical protein